MMILLMRKKEAKTYLFSSEEFSKLTSAPNVHYLRFVLGYDSGIISLALRQQEMIINTILIEIYKINLCQKFNMIEIFY